MWIERQLKRYDEGSGGLLAVLDKSNEKFLGQCGLLIQEVDKVDELEVGYGFIPKYWGKGYATEAANAMIQYAFKNSLSSYLISLIHPDNLNSQNVAKKNGLNIWKPTEFKGINVDVWRINMKLGPV